MAMDAFIKFDGGKVEVKGESVRRGHEEAIEPQSFSLGVMNTTNFSGTGLAAGKSSPQEFLFTKLTDYASPSLYLACANGDHFPTVVVTFYKSSGGEPVKYLEFTFDKVFITSVNWSGPGGGTGDIPMEQVSCAYKALTVEYKSQADEGDPKKNNMTAFDFALNAVP